MRDQIVRLAKDLITIPSVSGDIEKAVEILEFGKQQLANFAFTPFVSNTYPSLLFSNQGTDRRTFKIILNAHLDVVPGKKEQFHPYEKDGKLYGRGVFDMKAATAAMLLLFKNEAHKLSFPFGLQLTTDEELSGFHGTRYQVAQGVRADFVIMGECNSNLRVTNQSKGRHLIKIIIEGNTAHAAYPWHGKNALWEMYQALNPLMQAFPTPKEEIYKTTVSITRIKTENDATNKIPGNCTAFLDVRYAPEDKDTIIAKIKSLLPSTIRLEADHLRPYHSVEAKNKYITSLRKITQEIYGQDLPLRFAHATSDAPFFAAVGCDAIEFGPVGQNAHQDNEWVDSNSLETYYYILKKFLATVDTHVKSSPKIINLSSEKKALLPL
ncbi:MAG TPA: M20/M25/M40 family metallo-hydrolase [Methylomirabilota bacterium]|nr:M20/M25/M40 family metallo-hydrolase [Methylomirabilota bacterium]